MYQVYYITFTEDNGETYKRFAVPGKSIPDAYVELQMKIPGAEITDISLSGKTITIKNEV